MKGNQPIISVVLPFYNAEDTLDRAISSIQEQEFENFECILVNNNSTDQSSMIASEWVRRDGRFKLIHEEQQGVMFASNHGCDVSLGMYLARMDADDVAYPSRLRLQCKYLDEHPHVGVVAGLVKHVGDRDNTEGFRRFVEWSNSLVSFRDIFNRRFIEAPIVNPSAMWRRGTMEENGLYLHGDFPEDYEMWLRWLDQGVCIEKIPEVILEWHDSEKRLTRTDDIYSDRSFYQIKSKYLARWLAENNPFHPDVSVWGASRISRRRSRLLEQYGIRINAFIDTKRSRQLASELIFYEDLPSAGDDFILTYIRQMDNRERIQEFLENRGYREGKNYLMVS